MKLMLACIFNIPDALVDVASDSGFPLTMTERMSLVKSSVEVMPALSAIVEGGP